MTALLIIFVAVAIYGLKFYKINSYDNTPIDNFTTSSLYGLAIIMILLGNIASVIGNTPQNSIYHFSNTTLIGLGYGLLFFISGFGLLYNHTKNTKYIFSIITSKIPNLYFVYVLTNAIYVIFASIEGTRFTIIKVITNLLGIGFLNNFSTINPIGALIPVIILLYFVFFFIYLVGNKIKLSNEICTIFMIIAVVIFYIFNSILPYDYTFRLGIFCFVIGIVYALYYRQLNKFIQKHFLWCVFIISTILAINHFLFELIDKQQTYIAGLMCLLVISLSKCDFGNLALSTIKRVGLEIYLLQYFFIILFKDVIKLYNYSLNWYSLAVFFTTIVVGTLLHLAIKYSKKLIIKIIKNIKNKQEPLIG